MFRFHMGHAERSAAYDAWRTYDPVEDETDEVCTACEAAGLNGCWCELKESDDVTFIVFGTFQGHAMCQLFENFDDALDWQLQCIKQDSSAVLNLAALGGTDFGQLNFQLMD